MLAEQDQQDQNRRRKPFCMLIIVAMIILLPVESVIETKRAESTVDIILQKLSNLTETEKQPVTTDLVEIMGLLDNGEYEGRWTTIDKQKNRLLDSSEGRVQISFQKVYAGAGITIGAILRLFHKYYSDDGMVVLLLKPAIYNATEQYTQGRYEELLQQPITEYYDSMVKLNYNETNNPLNITTLNFTFTLTDDKKDLRLSVGIDSDKLSFQIDRTERSSTALPNLLLAFVVMVSATMQLTAMMRIFNRVLTGTESAQKYSLLSFMLFTCWDLAVTVMCFTLCFNNERYFIVYLLPTFISSILFSVLESRMVQVIYSTHYDLDHSNTLKFNLFMYGMFITTYFTVNYMNMSNLFLLALPLMILPQLYHNAYRGDRMEFDSNFISLYCSRFLLLIYLRGYARNIYQLEPSAAFCIELVGIVLLMVGLTYAQSKYGTRSLFPKFMLPKRYEYFEEEDHAAEAEAGIVGEDCAICLTPVHLRPEYEEHVHDDFVGKIMKTPCGHRFHGTCLAPWMQRKMDCPTCRSKLPPY